MSKACEKFGTPVTGGNVSFYNQTSIGNTIEPIYPTPTIGMLGILEDKKNQMTLSFRKKGDMIFLLGPVVDDIASSQYLVKYHKVLNSPCPAFDLEKEYAVQQVVMELIKKKLVTSVHDVSEGGLFINLLESSLQNNVGFDITTDAETRPDSFLFGESQSRVVVSVAEECEDAFIDLMISLRGKVGFMALGHVTKGELRVDDVSFGFISDHKKAYETTLENQL
jgi:phosphoribosylformylglycinamidine synthase